MTSSVFPAVAEPQCPMRDKAGIWILLRRFLEQSVGLFQRRSFLKPKLTQSFAKCLLNRLVAGIARGLVCLDHVLLSCTPLPFALANSGISARERKVLVG